MQFPYKKYLIGLAIFLILAIGGYFAYQYYFKKTGLPYPLLPKEPVKELTEEEILNSLTAPTDKTDFTKQDVEILNSLSVPEKIKSADVMTDQERQKILQSLTAPNNK